MSHPQVMNPMNGKQPDPEVLPRPKRRTFNAKYKLSIVQEADRCTEPGEIGALLRREDLFSSHLTTWRRQREAGELSGLSSRKRGRKKDEQAAKLTELQRENERLRKQLEQAELIIAAQKKLSQALEALTEQKKELS